MPHPLPPGTDVKLEVVRKEGGKTENVDRQAGAMPDEMPEKLPEPATLRRRWRRGRRAVTSAQADDDKKPETGLLKRPTPGGGHEYYVYVPDDYDPNIAYGLVLWLHPAGKGKEKDMEDPRRLGRPLRRQPFDFRRSRGRGRKWLARRAKPTSSSRPSAM